MVKKVSARVEKVNLTLNRFTKSNTSPGQRFMQAAASHDPLMLVGAVSPLCAQIAANSGLKALYLSGAGVANFDYALPDLALTSCEQVCASASRITQAVDLPLIVDADTGWGNPLNVIDTVKKIEATGCAGLHLEDQEFPKRCGHRDNKQIISIEKMCEKLESAVLAKQSKDFVIIGRTDVYQTFGLDEVIKRSQEYIKVGADMIFVEALSHIDEYKKVAEQLSVPIIANITEFGKTPIYSCEELANVGVSVVLYPLTVFRAMNKIAENVYTELAQKGSQKDILNLLQSRKELYSLLEYEKYEKFIDTLRD